MNNKIILAGLLLMYGLGTVTAYFLARIDIAPQAIAAPQPKQIDLKIEDKRATLETKYALCAGVKPDAVDLKRFDDTQLNDLVFNICSKNS